MTIQEFIRIAETRKRTKKKKEKPNYIQNIYIRGNEKSQIVDLRQKKNVCSQDRESCKIDCLNDPNKLCS